MMGERLKKRVERIEPNAVQIRGFLALFVALSASLGCLSSGCDKPRPPSMHPWPHYSPARVEVGPVEESVRYVARCLPEQRQTLAFERSGRVQVVWTSPWRLAREGEVLAALADPLGTGSDAMRELRCPSAGIVLEVKTQPGDFAVGKGVSIPATEAIIFGPEGPSRFEFKASEKIVERLKKAERVALSGPNFEESPAIPSFVPDEPGWVKVCVETEPHSGSVLGEEALVDFILDSDVGLRVPSKALTSRNGEIGVLKGQDASPVFVPVSVGLANQDWAQIMDGLSDGDTILCPCTAPPILGPA